MAVCTAAIEGHKSVAAAAACPVHGAGVATSAGTTRYAGRSSADVFTDSVRKHVANGDYATAARNVARTVNRRGDIPDGGSSEDVRVAVMAAIGSNSVRAGRAIQDRQAKDRVMETFGHAAVPFLGGSADNPRIRFTAEAERERHLGNLTVAAQLTVDEMAKTHGRPKGMTRDGSVRLVREAIVAESKNDLQSYVAEQHREHLGAMLGEPGRSIAAEIERL